MAEEWTVEHDEAARWFAVSLDGERAALNYELRGNAMVITHTGVPRAWEGRGIAASLTKSALEFARARGLKVVPVCSYAAAYMERHPEYGDLGKAD